MNEKSQKVVDDVKHHLDLARASIQDALEAMLGADPRNNGMDLDTLDGHLKAVEMLVDFKIEMGEL